MTVPFALTAVDATDEELDSFVAALLGEPAMRYDPNQPRKPDGKWGSGGSFGIGIGAISPGETSFANLPADYQGKVADRTMEAIGCDSATLEANIDSAYLAGRGNGGETWYATAHGEAVGIAEANGMSLETGAGMIAATSPQQEWGGNVACAKYTAGMVSKDEIPQLDHDTIAAIRTECVGERYPKNQSDPSRDLLAGKKKLSEYSTREQANIIRVTGSRKGITYIDDVTGKPRKVAWTCGSDGVEKAVRIGRGETPDAVLGGHKVRSFYNNIHDPGQTSSVTIDTHAMSAAAGRKITAQSPEMRKLMGAPSSKKHGTKGTYPQFADAYRAVAKKHGVAPDEVQAVTWIWWRQNYP